MKISSTVLSENAKTVEKVQPTVSSLSNQSYKDAHTSTNVSEMTDENGQPTEQAYQTAVNKMNEFMEYSQKKSKFVFHDGLEKYYVEIIDSKTEEVIKEIPPKELLDAYYEMQKLVGKMFDTQA